MKNQEKTYFYRLFIHLRFFTIFYDFSYNIQNSLKNIKGPIKSVFGAILLLQRERLKEMWWNKVAKTKKKHTSIDLFSIYDFFTIFHTTSKNSLKNIKGPIKSVFRAILLLQASCRALPKMLPSKKKQCSCCLFFSPIHNNNNNGVYKEMLQNAILLNSQDL